MSRTRQQELSPELLEKLARVGAACRTVADAAQRHDALVVAQALLVWENDEATASESPLVSAAPRPTPSRRAKSYRLASLPSIPLTYSGGLSAGTSGTPLEIVRNIAISDVLDDEETRQRAAWAGPTLFVVQELSTSDPNTALYLAHVKPGPGPNSDAIALQVTLTSIGTEDTIRSQVVLSPECVSDVFKSTSPIPADITTLAVTIVPLEQEPDVDSE